MFVSCSDGKRYHKEEEISKKAAVTSTYDFELDIKNHQHYCFLQLNLLIHFQI